MAAQPDIAPDLLDRIPAEQRALLLALDAHGGPVRARELADAAHVNRRSAGTRLEALAQVGLIIHREGTGATLAEHVRVYELTDTARVLLGNRDLVPGPGPVVHATVLADRVRPAADRTRSEITRVLGGAGQQIQSWINTELTRVYMAGVNDGFAQGVAAEAGARTQRPADA